MSQLLCHVAVLFPVISTGVFHLIYLFTWVADKAVAAPTSSQSDGSNEREFDSPSAESWVLFAVSRIQNCTVNLDLFKNIHRKLNLRSRGRNTFLQKVFIAGHPF